MNKGGTDALLTPLASWKYSSMHEGWKKPGRFLTLNDPYFDPLEVGRVQVGTKRGGQGSLKMLEEKDAKIRKKMDLDNSSLVNRTKQMP